MTVHIDISVPIFNIVKYILITLILTPVTEFATRVSIRVLAKTILLTSGSVTISNSRAGFWGLHSHYLGHGWVGKVLIIGTAAWLIASEMLLEFSFTSGQRTKSDVKEVWATTPAPSWDTVVQTVLESNNGSLEYYATARDIDYDLLYDGISACQSAVFDVEKKPQELVIKQQGIWSRSYRSLDNLTILCGEESSSATLSAKIPVVTSTSGEGFVVELFPSGDELDSDFVRRIERFHKKHKLFWKFNILAPSLRMHTSEDRIACVEHRGSFTFCVMEEAEVFTMYSHIDNIIDPLSVQILAEFVPQQTQRDPLLALAESIAIVISIGSFRPSGMISSGYRLAVRQFIDIIQVYLSLDSNGGITRHLQTEKATVRTETSSVIYVNSYMLTAAGLWGSLLLSMCVVVLTCHVVANRFRAKQTQHGIVHRKPALHEMKVEFSTAFFTEKIKHDKGFFNVCPGADGPAKLKTVAYKLVNDEESQQKISVLRGEEGRPRNYACSLAGVGNIERSARTGHFGRLFKRR